MCDRSKVTQQVWACLHSVFERRESSTPNCLTPYSGKYEVPETMPDGLYLQKIMAGQYERGATDCIIECTAAGLQEGRSATTSLCCA